MRYVIQWRCAEPHKDCEARTWKPYKDVTADEAKVFMAECAPNSGHFKYRLVKKKEEK